MSNAIKFTTRGEVALGVELRPTDRACSIYKNQRAQTRRLRALVIGGNAASQLMMVEMLEQENITTAVAAKCARSNSGIASRS